LLVIWVKNTKIGTRRQNMGHRGPRFSNMGLKRQNWYMLDMLPFNHLTRYQLTDHRSPIPDP